jgi:hypothetical protein
MKTNKDISIENIMKKSLMFLIYYVVLEPILTKYLFKSISIFKYVPEIIIYALMVILLTLIFVENKKIILFKHDKKLIYLFFYMFISTVIINRLDFKIFVLTSRTLYRYIFLYFLITNFSVSEQDIKVIIKHIVISGSFAVIIGTLQIFMPSAINPIVTPAELTIGHMVRSNVVLANGKAIFSLFERYDRYGLFLVLFILILCFLNNKKHKILITFALLNIIFTYSRQAWLALLIVAYLYLILKKKYDIIFIINGLVVLTVLCALAIQFVPQDIYFGTPLERLLQVFNKNYINTNLESARLRIFVDVLPTFLSRFNLYTWFGLGIGSFGMLANNLTNNALFMRYFKLFNVQKIGIYHIGDVYWIELLMEIGLLGMIIVAHYLVIAFLFYFKYYTKSTDNLSKKLNLTSMGFIIVCIIVNFFGPNLLITAFSFFFWMINGLTTRINIINTKQI